MPIRLKLLSWVFLILFVLSKARALSPCDAFPFGVEQSCQRALLVFTGTVRESSLAKFESETQLVSFTSEIFYKGKTVGPLVLRVPLRCNAIEFREGEDYLVFVRRDDNGNLVTDKSAGTIPLREARENIEYLEKHANACLASSAASELASATEKGELAACIDAVGSVVPGMTRKEVERRFRQDGGLQSFQSVRYIVPGCRDMPQGKVLKFLVEYEVSERTAEAKMNDRVKSVHEPMLELEIVD